MVKAVCVVAGDVKGNVFFEQVRKILYLFILLITFYSKIFQNIDNVMANSIIVKSNEKIIESHWSDYHNMYSNEVYGVPMYTDKT